MSELICPVTGKQCLKTDNICTLENSDTDCVIAIDTCADIFQMPMSIEQKQKFEGNMFELSARYNIDYNVFYELVQDEVRQDKKLDSSSQS